MGKRATTDYSHVVGIDKPPALTSHDVVDRVRRVYGERRVGHTGTLDPAATGALVVCVGPAARLDRFLTGHTKTYEFTVIFGTSTDTDDAQGAVVSTRPVAPELFDESIAVQKVANLVGPSTQLPPAYSAVRVAGKKAYEIARAGKQIDFAPRSIEVYAAQLLGIDRVDDVPVWHIRAHVSAGTYVRSLARDLGVSLGTVAHVGTLRRTQAGLLDVKECVSLEALEAHPFDHLLDPVRLLGYRVLFARDGIEADIANGKRIAAAGLHLFAYDGQGMEYALAQCTPSLHDDERPLEDGEYVSVVADNRLKAIYEYDAAQEVLRSACGFSKGVRRGGNL